ncbi:MAG TPA: sulfoxide reductase heme-binding subunit YedZ [Methylophilaceae bacterium]|nr:sulfoxide reductase heme-binding subunit YedZ [Methylophilaceae bacterium]HBO18830.1 sulfoxide reductase heme-binding subunit YedZ [Methylophilaceae bacterium]HCB68356.1 sulfoxide reductase heme-binding subunit YedZ [Methylophilaceae bacterium]
MKLNQIYIKRLIFTLSLWPILSLSIDILQNNLGANPVEFIERHFGKWTLIFLCLTLSMTPLRKITGISQWILYRRMLGLFVFFYASIHLLCYVGIDYQFAITDIKNDIVKHRYVLVGFLAWLLLLPLALTSSDKMIRRLKAHWKRLHRLIYLIAILGVLHFMWLVKKDITEPLIYAVIVLLLFILRLNILKFK